MSSNSAWKTRTKYWNIEHDEKRANIPRLLWKEGRMTFYEPWFKDEYYHIGRSQYVFK